MLSLQPIFVKNPLDKKRFLGHSELMEKEKKILAAISLAAAFLIAGVLYFQPAFFREWIIQIESDSYDRELKRHFRPVPPHPSIAIVAIDDKSIAKFGRWPWDRFRIAELTAKLHELGASTLAFDIVFSEAQSNPAAEIIPKVDNPALIEELKKLEPSFDADAALAAQLQKGTNILGFALASDGSSTGLLPAPLFTLQKGENSPIYEMNGSIGNLAQFQNTAGKAGFLNAMVDADGILRFSPLLLREGKKVYPSLALEAAGTFLSLPVTGILSTQSADRQILKGIQLGPMEIPTDSWGRILIPFRGPPYSFPYLSALDVLEGKVPREEVEGKLLFIGLTATASTDFLATAISPVYPGVEVQASIASGIIDGYLPMKPNWGRGAAVGLVLAIGVFAALVFPFISRLAAFAISIGILLAMEGINYWLWTRHALVLSFFFPIPTLAIIFLLDFVSMLLSDREQKQEIRRIFGSAASPSNLKRMTERKSELHLTGETKEITVLCARLKTIPSAAESLQNYFALLREIVFEDRGILAQSLQDEALALWGAPLPDSRQAYLAVKAGLDLQSRTKEPLCIGIDCGSALVGDFGGYTAFGDPAKKARLLKDHSGIRVTEAVYKKTQSEIAYRPPVSHPELGLIYEPFALKTEIL